ncbi:hypothetical protein EV702DRAFT_1202900 [Suillus placidus]|uniref:Uncharacterized protein n=1 Tax=Suillus placidus TaxID=48579 RepID=A0A9P6ZKE3_9AGAM|nr:hypothetical protein EV702DRAFT_1202900 [Suillus placidus]
MSGYTQKADRVRVEKTKTYERHYRSERKRASQKDNAAACLPEQLHSLQASSSNIAAGAQAAEAQLADTLQSVNHLKSRNETLTKWNCALTMRAACASAAKHHTIKKTRIHSTEATTNLFALKEKGIFTDTSCAMVRNMVATLDVPIWSVNATINAMAEALGVEITGSVSGHSIRRIVAEGGVAAEAQLVDEMNIAKGVTLSGDATLHKNINYQSHHITYSLPDGHAATQFAGILHEVNHKSETQLQGQKSCIEDMYDTYNDVVGSTAGALDVRDFLSKVKGMLTNHVEDQKKLVWLFTKWKQSCEREVRGERALVTLPPDDVVHLLWEMTESLINEVGGIDGWDRLGIDEQQSCYSNAHHNLLVQIGQEQFGSLPQSEKDVIDFFVWAGCCMHKELNTAKGGNSRMHAWWIDNSVEGPVLLMNKDNVAASSAGSSTPKQRAIQVSIGGAQKVLELAGAVFWHKDDKKGQQDSLRYYFEKLCKKACERDKSGKEHKQRFAQVEYDKEVVWQHQEQDIKKRARHDAAGAKLDMVVPRLTLEDITKLRTPEIDLQIVLAAKHIPTMKQKKVEVLLEAVGRYLSGEATPSGHPTSLQLQALDNNAVTSHLLRMNDD